MMIKCILLEQLSKKVFQNLPKIQKVNLLS